MKEKNLAAQLAAELDLSLVRARFMLNNPERGNSRARILAVIDRLEIAANTRDELRERLENIVEQPRRKGEKGRKLYAEIEGTRVEICDASMWRNAFKIVEREKKGELKYLGKGVLLQPLPRPRSHFEVGAVYHFWGKD